MSESLFIICPSCGATNRIPQSRLDDRPNCGACKQPLFGTPPVELTVNSFDRHLSRNSIPVVVDFWAAWCGPCKMMAPAFERAAAELEPNFRFGKLNTETEPGIASRFGIRSIPTMVLFRNGHEVARQAGAMGADDIARWVESQG